MVSAASTIWEHSCNFTDWFSSSAHMAAGLLISRLLLVFLLSEVKYSSVFPTNGVLGSPERETNPELTSNDFVQPEEAQISPLLKLVKGVLKRPSNTDVYNEHSMNQHHQEPQNQQSEHAIKWLAEVFRPKDNSLNNSRNRFRNTETSPHVYSQPSMYQQTQEPYHQQTEDGDKRWVDMMKPNEDFLVESKAPQSNTGIGSIIKSLIRTSDTTGTAELPRLQEQYDFGYAPWAEPSDVFSYPYEEMPTYDRIYPNVHLDVSVPFSPSFPYEPWDLQRIVGMINPFKQALLQTGLGQSLLFNPAGPRHFNSNPAYPFRQQYSCPHRHVSMYHPAQFPQQLPPVWPTLQHGPRHYHHPYHGSPYHFPQQHFASHPPHYGPQYRSPQQHNRRMFMK